MLCNTHIPQGRKVISWCLYLDPENKRRLPEYLVGLRCNQRAARFWFPGWDLKLYIDKSVNKSKDVAQFVKDITEFGYPKIEVIECREGINPMLERYRPFFDDDVAVCIARDVDSILGKADADLVNKWIKQDEFDVLRYREYEMPCKWSMGGGIGVKTRAFANKEKMREVPRIKLLGRGHDEPALAEMLEYIPGKRHFEVLTRMLDNGVYCFVANDPEKAIVLWNVPFFECECGYLQNELRTAWLDYASQNEVVKFCADYKIRREHIGAHWDHYRSVIINNAEWIR